MGPTHDLSLTVTKVVARRAAATRQGNKSARLEAGLRPLYGIRFSGMGCRKTSLGMS